MLQKLKARLKNWLFSKEQLELELRMLAYESLRENANVVALAREQLKLIDPTKLNLTDILNRNLTVYDGLTEEEQLDLINETHALTKNKALPIILDYLTRNQIVEGMMNATTINELNASRMTINAFSLVQETISSIEGAWLERNTPEEKDGGLTQFNVIP